jgi:hypothetical protein
MGTLRFTQPAGFSPDKIRWNSGVYAFISKGLDKGNGFASLYRVLVNDWRVFNTMIGGAVYGNYTSLYSVLCGVRC